MVFCARRSPAVCPDDEIVVGYWDEVGYKHKCDTIKIIIFLVVIFWQYEVAKTVSFWPILILKTARAV